MRDRPLEFRFSRKSRSSKPKIRNSMDPYFLHCTTATLTLKKSKLTHTMHQDEVEELFEKKIRTADGEHETYFCENRIKFVLLKGQKNRPSIPYSQIRGAFSIRERPKVLILGVEYPHLKQRRYEVLCFRNVEIAEDVKELILHVSKQSDNLVSGYEPVGHISARSSRSLSSLGNRSSRGFERSRRLGSTPGIRTRDSGEDEYNTVKSDRVIQSQSTIDLNRDRKQSLLNREEYNGSSIVYLSQRSFVRSTPMDPLTSSRIIASRNSYHQTLMDELNPDHVIFITNDSAGPHIVNDGPIFMFCQSVSVK